MEKTFINYLYLEEMKGWQTKHKNAKSFKDFNEMLREIEKKLFILSAPFFSYSYPQNNSNMEILDLPCSQFIKKQYELTDCEFHKLLNNGFIVADKSFFDSLIVNPYDYFIKHDNFLIDEGYGIICEKAKDRYINCPLDIGHFDAYLKKYPFLKDSSDVLEIGHILAHKIVNKPKSNEIMTFHVKNREELKKIIEFWAERIKNSPFSLWFRGQTNEYYCTDFREIIENKRIFPWRGMVDIALTPSIFRIKDIKKYSAKLADSLKYHFILNDYFKKCLMTKRCFGDKIKEKIPKHLISLEWSTSIYIDGKPFEIHDYHNQYTELVKSLFNQHYGLESPLLDITSNVDIALFFAQNQLKNNRYIKINRNKANPVIYGFILNNEFDPVIDSSILMQDLSALRPVRQKCGVIMGAHNLCKEFYSRYISFKIKLDEDIPYNQNYTPEYLFPSEDEDSFLKLIKQIKKGAEINNLTPFELK